MSEPRTDSPLPAAKAPVGSGPVPFIGIVISLVVMAFGVVAVRDALVASGAVSGDEWTTTLVEAIDGLRPTSWFVPVAILLLVLGLCVFIAALSPRPRTSLAVRARTGVYLTPRHVGRVSRSAAQDVDGVISASATATRRAVRVGIHGTGDDSIHAAVQAAVQQRLSALTTPPTVRVRTRARGAAS